MKPLKIGILGSSRGTALQAVIDAIEKKQLSASIEIIISNKEDAYLLTRAKNHNLPAQFISSDGLSREEYDKKLSDLFEKYQVDIILLIGYMRILSKSFVNTWWRKLLNVHPSLLPEFPGMMDLDVHQAVIDAEKKESGCTIHYVTHQVDEGPVVIQKKCDVYKDDTKETLKKRVQALEGQSFIEAIRLLQSTNELPTDLIPVKRALLSVSDKQGIQAFAKKLTNENIEIISTGGTAKELKTQGITVTSVDTITGFPEIMQGRVKTLHPKIHGAILGKRDQHESEANEHHIEWIDLVVCNLYPFKQTIEKLGTTLETALENIDIGGPTMIRAAAKNHPWVCVVVDPNDYDHLINEINSFGGVTAGTRKYLATKAFAHTAQYDATISHYLTHETFPQTLNMSYKRLQALRYGENPHQTASVYQSLNQIPNSLLHAEQLQGKQLSYNNIADGDAALQCVSQFKEPACVVVKHANPCGVAVRKNINDAMIAAFEADSQSAFGGIIALNRPCTKDIAEYLKKVFIEMIIAPSFEKDALAILKTKQNVRLLAVGEIAVTNQYKVGKLIAGGLLIQDADTQTLSRDGLNLVTEAKPSDSDLDSLLFAWHVVKYIKSNAILIANNQTTFGVGAGQVSRVDATKLAIQKAGQHSKGAVLASDAFFPFRDSIDQIAKAGIQSIIQPGGSIRDDEVIAACNEYGISMVFTGIRCFNH